MCFLCKNEYRIFKFVEIIIRRELGKKEKNRGDESRRVIIHIHMEMSQGNSLCSNLKQKWHFFSFTKLGNKRIEQVLSGGASHQ
jgi:hypothetical protein